MTEGHFGYWLRLKRLELKLDQIDVSKRGGISQSYLSDLERGQFKIPSTKMRVKIAQGLGIEVLEIEEAIRRAEILAYKRLGIESEDKKIPVEPEPSPEEIRLPLVMSIAPGTALLARENRSGMITVLRRQVEDQLITFAFRVPDNRMRGEGLLVNDLLIARQAEAAKDNQLIIALPEGSNNLVVGRLKDKQLIFEGALSTETYEGSFRVVGVVTHLERTVF